METMWLPPLPPPALSHVVPSPGVGLQGWYRPLDFPHAGAEPAGVELALLELRVLWMVMSLPQAWKLVKNLPSSSLLGARSSKPVPSLLLASSASPHQIRLVIVFPLSHCPVAPLLLYQDCLLLLVFVLLPLRHIPIVSYTMGYLASCLLENTALKPLLECVPALALVTSCQSPGIGRH